MTERFAEHRRLGIMQPYFFPYWGHFCLIARTEAWVVFDTPQYTPKTWMNRNRILHPSQGWQYLSVPLSNGSIHIRVHEARVKDRAATHRSMRGKLDHYRKRAPFFAETVAVLDAAFEGAEDDSLVALNVAGLEAACAYLGLPFHWRRASRLGLDLPEDLGPGQWAPHIAAGLGAAGYVNPAGGRELFDPAEFAGLGVDLGFLGHGTLDYDCPGYAFEPNLSILDAMMWLPPDTLAEAIRTRCEISLP